MGLKIGKIIDENEIEKSDIEKKKKKSLKT